MIVGYAEMPHINSFRFLFPSTSKSAERFLDWLTKDDLFYKKTYNGTKFFKKDNKPSNLQVDTRSRALLDFLSSSYNLKQNQQHPKIVENPAMNTIISEKKVATKLYRTRMLSLTKGKFKNTNHGVIRDIIVNDWINNGRELTSRKPDEKLVFNTLVQSTTSKMVLNSSNDDFLDSLYPMTGKRYNHFINRRKNTPFLNDIIARRMVMEKDWKGMIRMTNSNDDVEYAKTHFLDFDNDDKYVIWSVISKALHKVTKKKIAKKNVPSFKKEILFLSDHPNNVVQERFSEVIEELSSSLWKASKKNFCEMLKVVKEGSKNEKATDVAVDLLKTCEQIGYI